MLAAPLEAAQRYLLPLEAAVFVRRTGAAGRGRHKRQRQPLTSCMCQTSSQTVAKTDHPPQRTRLEQLLELMPRRLLCRLWVVGGHKGGQ